MTILTTNRQAGPFPEGQYAMSFAFKVFSPTDVAVLETVGDTTTALVYGTQYTVGLNTDQDMNPGEVFSRVQDHVVAAANAHVERLVLEALVDKVRGVHDGDTKVALTRLCDLFALTTIEADRAWFMEHGRLTVQRSKAISREVNALCRKIRPIAVDLVDAWGVPPEMLRSPDLV